MTVYIDIYFFNNFIINLFLISLSGILLKRNIKPTRVIISSAVGAIYSCVSLFIDISYIKFPISIAMIVIAYRLSFKEHVKQIGVFYIVTYVFAGAVMRFLPLKGENISEFNANLYFIVPDFVIVIAAGITFLFLYLFLDNIIKKRRIYRFYGKAVIKIRDRILKTPTFTDSGNGLVDYVTGLPVCIISRKLYKKMKIGCNLLIPCTTVNGESYLDAFIPGEFYFNGKKVNVVLAVSDAINDKDYGVLMNSTFLKGEDEIAVSEDDRVYKNDLCG